MTRVGQTGLALNGNPFRFRGLMFGEPQLQDAVMDIRLDLFRINRSRQGKDALEAPIAPFPAMVAILRDLSLRLPFPTNGQGAVMDFYVEMIFLYTWEFRLQDKALIGLIDIYRRDLGTGPPTGLLAVAAPSEFMKHAVHLLL
jgi:hypothetical protein